MKRRFSPPIFSRDGRRLAAAVKDNGRWTIAVDGVPWTETFDMIWDPVFSPNGKYVAAKAERKKEMFLVINGKAVTKGFQNMCEPVFSPDGSKILINDLELGRVYRRLLSVNQLLR